MPHLNREPGGVDTTASAYIVRTDFDEPKIMFHLHRKLGVYLQYGGHKEANQNIWQTIIAELREESGYDISQLEVLQPTPRLRALPGARAGFLALHPIPVTNLSHKFIDGNDPELTDHQHNDLAFAFVTNEPPRHAPDDGETDETALFTRAELEQLTTVPENVRAISIFILDEVLAHWEAVPTSEFGV